MIFRVEEVRIMYENLELLIFKNKISKYEIANKLGVTYNTLLAKMSGKQPFKLDEAFLIRKEYFPDKDFEYLFKKSA